MTNKTLEIHDKRFHESLLKRTGNSLMVTFFKGISYLPFWVLFRISDLLYVVLRFGVKYRKKVITENLRHAFPEKSEKEIRSVRRKFYRHFCDVFVETVKAYSMSAKTMDRHLKFLNINIFEEEYARNRSLVLLGMHYNNWEWSSYASRYGRHPLTVLYNPIRGNAAFERFVTHLRTRWGATAVPVHRSSRLVLNFGKAETPKAIWLGADQTPPATSKFWTVFFHREAPFFSGPEKIAYRSGMPVYLHVTRKVARGKYEVEFLPLVDQPAELDDPNEILLKYIRKMEEIIREAPEFYLWSHRRWKHVRPPGVELLG